MPVKGSEGYDLELSPIFEGAVVNIGVSARISVVGWDYAGILSDAGTSKAESSELTGKGYTGRADRIRLCSICYEHVCSSRCAFL